MNIKSFRIRIGFVIDGFVIICTEKKEILMFKKQDNKYVEHWSGKTSLWANHAWITSDKHVIIGFRENGYADVFKFYPEGKMTAKIWRQKFYPENIYSVCEISKNKFFLGGKDHGAHGYYIRLNTDNYKHGRLFKLGKNKCFFRIQRVSGNTFVGSSDSSLYILDPVRQTI